MVPGLYKEDYRTAAGGLTTKRWQKNQWSTNKKHQSSEKRKQTPSSKFVSRSKLQNHISVNMFNQFTVSKMERLGEIFRKTTETVNFASKIKKKKSSTSRFEFPDLLRLYRWPPKK